MQKLKQMVVMRESHERDEGTMGFHDYVTVFQSTLPHGERPDRSGVLCCGHEEKENLQFQ